jgi:uncharacterized protein (UPF0548 family)
MFFLRRPSPAIIDAHVRRSRELPFSYSPIGIVRTETTGYQFDQVVVPIGRGRADFARARAALAAWKQFDIGWVELFPRQASIDIGTNVAVLIRHFGFWSLNGCRVVYSIGDEEHDLRFGYAYGALTSHAEAGEEIFEVLIDPRTDAVLYRIRAVSWPRVVLTHLGQPIVRLLQARFRRDSVEAMRRATKDPDRR